MFSCKCSLQRDIGLVRGLLFLLYYGLPCGGSEGERCPFLFSRFQGNLLDISFHLSWELETWKVTMVFVLTP